MAVCIAVIGKENSPKFIRCLDKNEEINFHFKVHTSLDIIEEKLAAPAGKNLNDQKELYLGLLFSTENHKIFGYVTNTRVKLIVVVESTNTSLRDNEVRTFRCSENCTWPTLTRFAIHSMFLEKWLLQRNLKQSLTQS
ncbi:trafficking protein particle complex subunit 2-like protein isoform X2 [Nilaparvata lugens]|uniref:trafficking protein particle complex subunit 2-like protein isoform X2 n=1 Tax=Nilaparvata lugens TaxID=108931 RepID=UPI000B986C0B|nr:trafficking protein particle complex subunit 2-like protein isoform X2 [Nilaparvata lugens]